MYATSYPKLPHGIQTQLPAAGGHVDAAALADGAGQAVAGQDGLEGARRRAGRRLAVVAERGVERNEVDVGVHSGQ